MGDLTLHFSRHEFACSHCGAVHVLTPAEDPGGLVARLQHFRERAGRPVFVGCGGRCPTWNREVGGASGSFHLFTPALPCRAADVTVAGASLTDMARWGMESGFHGIGLYTAVEDLHGAFVHLDTRPGPAAWWGFGEPGRPRIYLPIPYDTLRRRLAAQGGP